MTNQVVDYDRLSNKVKLIDGAVTIPLEKAEHKGFTPAHLMHLACEVLSLHKDAKSQHALKVAEQALKACQDAQQGQTEYKNKEYK